MIKKVIAVLLIAFLFSACDGSDDNDGKPRIKVLHGSPDAPNVDFLVNDVPAIQNVPYGESSEYFEVNSGSNNYKVNVAGTSQTVLDVTPSLQDDTNYTIVAGNLVSKIEPIVLVDNPSSDVQQGSNIRIVHAAPSAPAVDIQLIHIDNTPVVPQSTDRNISFKGVRDYQVGPAGRYNIIVTPAGQSTTVINKNIELADERAYTLYVVDKKGGGAPFDILVEEDRE